MNIQTYLAEVDHCVSSIFPLVWNEKEKQNQLKDELDALTKRVHAEYLRAQSLSMNAEDPEEVAMAAGMHWDTYFGDDKERFHKNTELSELEAKLKNRLFSIDSLSGSLLQYAKQGISIVHGKLSQCPIGRDVQGHELKQVIWQGRNQALHWEAGNPHPPVVALFDSLTASVDSKFSDYRTRNCAFDILDLLGWKSATDFNNDMSLLA